MKPNYKSITEIADFYRPLVTLMLQILVSSKKKKNPNSFIL